MFYLVSVIATVMALPSPETLGRLLLLLNEVNETTSSKRSKKSSYKVGTLVEAEVCGFICFQNICIYVFTAFFKHTYTWTVIGFIIMNEINMAIIFLFTSRSVPCLEVANIFQLL